MTQNAPPSASQMPKMPSSESADKKEEPQKEDPRLSNPAARAGVDPLAGVMPCVTESCEAPQGTFQKRASLEKLMQQSETGTETGGKEDTSDTDLTEEIRKAVDVAIVSLTRNLLMHTAPTRVMSIFIP